MTLIQMRIFLAAARFGSFTAAASALHMSQPTVSEAIRRIERHYGTPLFVRGPRKLVLTAAGEALLPLAEQTVASADAADSAVKAVTGLRGGVASFGLLRNAKLYAMADLLTRFHAEHPEVRLRVIGVNSAEVASLVRAGELEAGLIVLPVDTEELSVTPLLRDEVLYASAEQGHVAEPPSMADLAARNLIVYDAHTGWLDPTRRQLAERALLEGMVLEPTIEVEQVDAALELVAAGAGDTFVSRSIVARGSVPEGLHFTPFAEPLYDTIALVHRSNSVLSPATAELSRLARIMLSRLPGTVAPRSSS